MWVVIRRVLSLSIWDNLLVALLIVGFILSVVLNPARLIVIPVNLAIYGWFFHSLWHQKWKAVRKFWRFYQIGLAVLIVLTFVLAHIYADAIKG